MAEELRRRNVTIPVITADADLLPKDASLRKSYVGTDNYELGVKLEAVLITHTHVDHIGACAAVAEHTGAPVYCPELEVPVLQDIMAFVPWPGFVPMIYRQYSEPFWHGDYKVLRGGSWAVGGNAIRPSFRNWDHPIRRQIFSGVRLAWDD